MSFLSQLGSEDRSAPVMDCVGVEFLCGVGSLGLLLSVCVGRLTCRAFSLFVHVRFARHLTWDIVRSSVEVIDCRRTALPG